jgi:hypothetical protein
MGRKLALVGLVLFAVRGSIAQLSAATALSFGFFALQVFTCEPAPAHLIPLYSHIHNPLAQ